MASSSSNLVNNLSEGFDRVKCKLGHDDKKCETCAVNNRCCKCFLEYTNFKDDLIECKCLCCNKSYQFYIQTNFLTMITISLFYHYEEVFTLKNNWWLGKIQWNFITWKRIFL